MRIQMLCSKVITLYKVEIPLLLKVVPVFVRIILPQEITILLRHDWSASSSQNILTRNIRLDGIELLFLTN